MLKLQYLARCCTGGVLHTNRRGHGSPAAGLDKALSTFRVEHCGGAWATDSCQRDRRNRARTTIFAIIAGKNYAHRLSDLGLARERVLGKRVEVIPNTSPTHSCCIVKVAGMHNHVYTCTVTGCRDSAELKVLRASIALCTLASDQTPFKEERRV